MAEESDTRTANHEEIRIHLTNVLNFILRQLESENFDKNNIQYIYITCIYTVYIYIYIYIYTVSIVYIYIYYSTIYRHVFRCSTAHQCSLVQSG